MTEGEWPPSEAELRAARSRRGVLILRALHSPEGLTKYGYTKGMLKIDAMKFWTDARTLGFVKLGTNTRGTNLFGFRSEPIEDAPQTVEALTAELDAARATLTKARNVWAGSWQLRPGFWDAPPPEFLE